jgi:hypothetical protein
VSIEAVHKLRSYRTTDIPFIQNSWASSYYKGAEYDKLMSPQEFNDQHRPVREFLLRQPTVTAIVACDQNDHDLILGWALIERPLKIKGLFLHYIYIKEAFKNEGLAKDLIEKSLPEPPIMVTHMTDKARKIIKAKKPDFVYAKDLILVQDKYRHVLDQLDHYQPKGEM